MTLTGKRLAFIGGGTMAEAMVRGLLDRHLVPPSHVLVTGPRRERRAELTKTYGVKALASNAEAAADAHVIVLSVKPQVLATVMRELRGKLDEDKLVISIVAGATLRSLRDGLDHAAIVRAMPNTPAQVGMGVTAWTSTTAVDAEQRDRAKAILGALGEELMVDDENLVDMATALSGTGPTYVFLLMEALVDAGVHLGFSRRVAEELVLRTVEGSAVFARKSGRHLAELRNMVTSPGGTSAAAIYQLEKGALRTVLSKAVYAAYQRASSAPRRSGGTKSVREDGRHRARRRPGVLRRSVARFGRRANRRHGRRGRPSLPDRGCARGGATARRDRHRVHRGSPDPDRRSFAERRLSTGHRGSRIQRCGCARRSAAWDHGAEERVFVQRVRPSPGRSAPRRPRRPAGSSRDRRPS